MWLLCLDVLSIPTQCFKVWTTIDSQLFSCSLHQNNGACHRRQSHPMFVCLAKGWPTQPLSTYHFQISFTPFQHKAVHIQSTHSYYCNIPFISIFKAYIIMYNDHYITHMQHFTYLKIEPFYCTCNIFLDNNIDWPDFAFKCSLPSVLSWRNVCILSLKLQLVTKFI